MATQKYIQSNGNVINLNDGGGETAHVNLSPLYYYPAQGKRLRG